MLQCTGKVQVEIKYFFLVNEKGNIKKWLWERWRNWWEKSGKEEKGDLKCVRDIFSLTQYQAALKNQRRAHSGWRIFFFHFKEYSSINGFLNIHIVCCKYEERFVSFHQHLFYFKKDFPFTLEKWVPTGGFLRINTPRRNMSLRMCLPL